MVKSSQSPLPMKGQDMNVATLRPHQLGPTLETRKRGNPLKPKAPKGNPLPQDQGHRPRSLENRRNHKILPARGRHPRLRERKETQVPGGERRWKYGGS
jgi:hypothetical protein